jgi:16S rRNA U1498 N3-methylase RsmE
MTTPRFYISPLNWNLDRLALEGDEAQHCLDVLRMGVGERVVVFDGRGREATLIFKMQPVKFPLRN